MHATQTPTHSALIRFRRHPYWHFWSNALRRTLQVTCAVQCRVLTVIFMLWLSGLWLLKILYVGNQVPEEYVVAIFRIDPEVGDCTVSQHRASLTHSTLIVVKTWTVTSLSSSAALGGHSLFLYLSAVLLGSSVLLEFLTQLPDRLVTQLNHRCSPVVLVCDPSV